MTGLAFIDTETLGLDPHRHPIWEIAVIIPDGPHAGENCWQVWLTDDQIAAAEPEALEVNGFHDRYEPGTAIISSTSAVLFAELTRGRHLVGAVPSFDEERLRRMHDELHLGRPDHYPWHYHLIDVEAMAVGYLAAQGTPVQLPWSSDDLSRLVGIEPPTGDDRHSALGDARWARRIYDAITGDPQ